MNASPTDPAAPSADRGPGGSRTEGPAPQNQRRTRADRARQVAEVLRRQIASGAFTSGVLPDERVLIADFAVSRNTVREALGVLRDEGVVERRQGVGTVIVRRPYEHTLDRLTGLAETLRTHGEVINQVRVADVVRPPSEVARKLQVPDGGRVVYIERLRLLDGVPLSLDLTYLVLDIGEPLLTADLAGRDLFGLIEQSTGGRLGSASVTVHAVGGDPHTCALLDIPAGSALFTVERLTRLPDGRPVDLEFLRIRGDRLAFRAELVRAVPDVPDPHAAPASRDDEGARGEGGER
ncbi:GntR family transcriptional regulator [Streptomyces sp. NPDC029674]|uniref:GntR family transcriptional regulator n=1 Tax=Streptomyces sp. NPDC029674 TaxID=3365297 RepID=UPI00384C7C87